MRWSGVSDEAPPSVLKPCECGECDKLVSTGGNGRQRFFPGHRQRAYRKRVKTAMEARGLPASPSLRVARAPGPTGERNGDAKATRSGLQVSYRKAVEAVAWILHDDLDIYYDEAYRRAEEALREQLSDKQRARLDARRDV
jgi:hypothetical protein